MSGALSRIVAAMVATVIPMEVLLFVAGNEQQNTTDCAQAVVESIAAEFWGLPVAVPRESDEGDFSMSVAEIHELLTSNGIENRAYWMSWEKTIQVTEDFGPVIAHFDRPTGHYAVAVGGVSSVSGINGSELRSGKRDAGTSRNPRQRYPLPTHHLLIADPARGDIIVSKAWWNRHASGAVMVVDTEWDRRMQDIHVQNAQRRLRQLEAIRDEQ